MGGRAAGGDAVFVWGGSPGPDASCPVPSPRRLACARRVAWVTLRRAGDVTRSRKCASWARARGGGGWRRQRQRQRQPVPGGSGSRSRVARSLPDPGRGGDGRGALSEGLVVRGPMAAPPEGAPKAAVAEVRCAGSGPLRLLEWRVAAGAAVRIGSVLAVCEAAVSPPSASAPPSGPTPTLAGPGGCVRAERRLRSERAGVVRELCAQPGQVLAPG